MALFKVLEEDDNVFYYRGDFNQTLSLHENYEGLHLPNKLIDDFIEVVDQCCMEKMFGVSEPLR